MNILAGRLRLDLRSDEPIYLQIVRQIETLVHEGTLKPGDQLPTVRELAIDLRINFSTVARAYRILDEQQLISTQRGRGTYIWDEDGSEGPVGSGDAPAEGEAPTAIAERLPGLTRRFIAEAAELGASPEQIEEVFRQQVEHWKRDRLNHSSKEFGG